MGLKNIILAIFIIAITILVLISTVSVSNSKTETHMQTQTQTLVTKETPRVSRFLAQNAKNGRRNAKAADHCNKNEEICKSQGSSNSTMACCSNKCVDVAYNDDYCGACNNQCKFTQTCCGGECVYLAYDKRHCGECNHRCLVGDLCVYGLCKYA